MKSALIAALLFAAVLVQLLCVIGLWRMPHVYDRLHFVMPATSVAPWFAAAAIWTREALNHQGIMSLLVALFLTVFGSLLIHATARAARMREKDGPA